ncbi:hypothetical protein O6H91_Y570600 [Diphasiastrum complanatum]|nr:hypothetical protein O6H91_Y570600 [Diphasiastrum complanatum]
MGLESEDIKDQSNGLQYLNTSRAFMQRQEIFLDGQPLDIVSSYTYLGVLFTRPIFTMRQVASDRLGKGHSSLVQLERFCFRSHIYDAPSKCSLFDTMVTPTALYAAEAWCTSLTSSDWSRISRLQVTMLSRMIQSR